MCGIFGIDGCDDAANLTYLGLYAQQHRGQESAGMVSWDGAQLHLERGMGHVSEIFKEKVIARLPGRRALGHTRYSTAGSSVVANAQPIVVKTSMGPVGIVHNGNLVNPLEIRERLELAGSIFQTTSDTEVILHLMARNPRPDLVESFMEALGQVRGAYSLLLITDRCLIAARDPNGFRPLVMGEYEGGKGVPGSAAYERKGLGRPRSYLNGRVAESWTADGGGSREMGEGATDTDLHGRAPTGMEGKADLAKRLAPALCGREARTGNEMTGGGNAA